MDAIDDLINTTISFQLKNEKNIVLITSTIHNIMYYMTTKMLLSTKNYMMFWNN
jgi:hypothetical protein